jgi:hypothetical protein
VYHPSHFNIVPRLWFDGPTRNPTPQVNLVLPSSLSSDTFKAQQYGKPKQKIFVHVSSGTRNTMTSARLTIQSGSTRAASAPLSARTGLPPIQGTGNNGTKQCPTTPLIAPQSRLTKTGRGVYYHSFPPSTPVERNTVIFSTPSFRPRFIKESLLYTSPRRRLHSPFRSVDRMYPQGDLYSIQRDTGPPNHGSISFKTQRLQMHNVV